jgi:hypothetical protein
MPATSRAVPTEQTVRQLSRFVALGGDRFIDDSPRIINLLGVSDDDLFLELYGNGSAGSLDESKHFAPGTAPQDIESQYIETAQTIMESAVFESLTAAQKEELRCSQLSQSQSQGPSHYHPSAKASHLQFEASRRTSVILGFGAPTSGYDSAERFARIISAAGADQRQRSKLEVWQSLLKLLGELKSDLRTKRHTAEAEHQFQAAKVIEKALDTILTTHSKSVEGFGFKRGSPVKTEEPKPKKTKQQEREQGPTTTAH